MDFSKINELKHYDLNCNIFDVYSYGGLSMQELLCQFFTKINECIKTSNETIDLAEWLVNEGLKQEVVLKLTTWLNDGTLENIINVTLFENLNSKIDNVSSQLGHIAIDEVSETTSPNQVINFGGDKDYDNIKKFEANKKYINHVGGVLNGLSSNVTDYHNFLIAGENISLNDLCFNCKSPHRGVYIGTSDNVEINNCSIDSVSSGIVSDSTVKHVKIDNNDIISGNYGILFDENCVNSEDVTISNNNIIAVADGIEINSPNEDKDIVLKNVKILNNTINQTKHFSNGVAGFGIGIANTQGVICSNNYIKDAKNEGIHIEDCQEGVIINSNIVNSSRHGIAILRNVERNYNEGTIVCSNNFIKGKNVGNGIELVLGSFEDSNGSVETVILTNNVVNNFGIGILLNGENSDTRYCSANLDGCVIEDCRTGLVTTRDVSGRITFRNVDKCVEIKNGIVESIICNTPITGRDILTWNLKTLGYGCIKHINYKTFQFTTVNGYNKFELFTIGDYIKGNFLINIKILGGGSGLKVFGSVDGDATTLNWTRKLKQSFGMIDDGEIILEDGKLYFKFYSAKDGDIYSANVDFDGENIKVV